MLYCTLTHLTDVSIFYCIWPIFIVTAVSRLIIYNGAHSVPCSHTHYRSKLFGYVGIILLSSIINPNSDSIWESHVSLLHVSQIQFLMTCSKLGRNFSFLTPCYGKDNNIQLNQKFSSSTLHFWAGGESRCWRKPGQNSPYLRHTFKKIFPWTLNVVLIIFCRNCLRKLRFHGVTLLQMLSCLH